MKNLLIAFCIGLLFSCSGDDKVSSFLECEGFENFKSYEGEVLGCRYHYALTEYEGEEYVELRAHCDDLVRAYVFNKCCKDICETEPYSNSSPCGKYLEGREVIEIVLIAVE